MRVQVAGRQMDVGEALRTRIEDELTAGVSKYFSRATDAVVTVGKNGVGCEVDCLLHLSSGISLYAQGHGGDAHAAFDNALTKLETRVRRHKRRLKNHHADNKAPFPPRTHPAMCSRRSRTLTTSTTKKPTHPRRRMGRRKLPW